MQATTYTNSNQTVDMERRYEDLLEKQMQETNVLRLQLADATASTKFKEAEIVKLREEVIHISQIY